MKKRLSYYLSKKNSSNYTTLDQIFIYFNLGLLESFLIENKFKKIEQHVILSHKKFLQLNFIYYNLSIHLEFSEKGYSYLIKNKKASYMEGSIFENLYSDDFNIESFLLKLLENINAYPKLIKEENLNNKRIIKYFKHISFWVSLLFIAFITIYYFVLDNYIEPNGIFILLIIPLFIWFIYDIKSKHDD